MPQVFQLDQWSKTLHPKYDHQVRYSLDKCVVVPQQKQVSASSQCSPPTAFYTSQKQTSWPKYVHWYSDEREKAEFLISSSKSSAFSSSDCFLSEQTSAILLSPTQWQCWRENMKGVALKNNPSCGDLRWKPSLSRESALTVGVKE